MSNVEIRKSLVAVNALSSVLAHLVSVLVLVWVTKYLIEKLDKLEYEVYPLVIALVMFLKILTASITGGIARYVTEAYAKGERERVTEIVSSMIPSIAFASGAFLVFGGVAAWNIGMVFEIDSRFLPGAKIMVALLVLSHSITLFAMPFSVGPQVMQKFVWLNVIRLGEQIVRLTLLLILVLFDDNPKVVYVVVASESALIIATVVTFVYSRRLIPELRFRRGAYRKETARLLTSFGAWTMLGSLMHRIRTSADVLILGWGMENPLQRAWHVTAFHIGMIPDRQMDHVVGVASNTIQPALTAMHATNRHAGLVNAYLRGNRYYLWIAMGVAAPLMVFCRELTDLYTSGMYMIAAPVIALTMIRYPINYATEMLYRVAMAKAKIKKFFLVASSGGLAHVGLTWYLVAELDMGAWGVAYSSVIVAAVIQFVFFWPMGLRMLEIDFSRFYRESLLPGMMPGLLAAYLSWGVSALYPPDGWWILGAETLFGLAAYCGFVILFFRPEDRRDLGPLWNKVRGKLGAGRAEARDSE